jgi:hypothetical protein
VAEAEARNQLAVRRNPGDFTRGYDARRGTSGGRPRSIREIEEMLDAEHRTLDKMREVFGKLRSLALDEVVRVFMDKKGEAHETTEPPDPAFMRLYLDRVLGPVKLVDDGRVDEAVRERFEELIAEARARRERGEP